MVYRKRRFYKRRYNRVKGNFNKKVGRVLERRIEKKYVDVDLLSPPSGSAISYNNFQAITTSGSGYNLTAIGTGSSQNNRVGNQIVLKSLRFKGSFYAGTSSLVGNDHNNEIRILVLKVKDPQDISTIAPNNIFTTYSSFSTRAMVDTNKFTVLYDKTKVTHNSTEDAIVPAQFDFSINLRKMRVRYTSNQASTPSHGQLILYAVSDSSGIPHPTSYSCSVRLKYYDL